MPLPCTPEAGLQHLEARAVDDDRDACDLGLGRDQPQEPRHRLDRVEQVGVHVHVEKVRAAPNLLECHVDGGRVVICLDQLPEARRARHVGALPDHHEARVRADLERLEAAVARAPRRLRDRPRREALHGSRDFRGVLRGRAAAAADDVDEAILGEAAQEPARVAGLLVVEPESVRKTRVRVARHPGRRDA
jgi:hypothetical protein